jgi:hypothetical protein
MVVKKRKTYTYRAVDYANAAIAQLAKLLNVTRAFDGTEPIGIDLDTLGFVNLIWPTLIFSFGPPRLVGFFHPL